MRRVGATILTRNARLRRKPLRKLAAGTPVMVVIATDGRQSNPSSNLPLYKLVENVPVLFDLN